MLLLLAPEQVLQLISCGCKKFGCITRGCVCRMHGLPCTDLCNCVSCENKKLCNCVSCENKKDIDHDRSDDDESLDDESGEILDADESCDDNSGDD